MLYYGFLSCTDHGRGHAGWACDEILAGEGSKVMAPQIIQVIRKAMNPLTYQVIDVNPQVHILVLKPMVT